MFNEQKTAQMAAFFLARSKAGKMPHLKLMKLLYLSEREAVRAFGRPMSGDCLVSMPHGPVLSRTLDLINGYVESRPGGWEEWVSDKENHTVALRNPLGEPSSLGELSAAETELLQLIWEKFGGMSQWEIRDWTHQHCAEWQDPHGSSLPIGYEALAKAIGFDADAAREVAEQIQTEQEVDSIFDNL